MENNNFYNRFNMLLKQKNIKQVDLLKIADEQGIKLGKSQISQYVSGKTLPRREILEFLASVLEVEADWLRGNGNDEGSIEERNDEYFVRTFGKSTKLDNVLYDVRGPVVEEAARMESEGTQVLKLNIGNPAPFGFRTPDEVIYDMRSQLTECEGYSDSKGALYQV